MANPHSIDPTVLEREMLQAAASETAPLAARRRALANLGLLSIAPSTLGAANAGRVAAKAMWWKAPLAKFGIVLGIGGAMAGGAVALRQPQVATSAALQQTRAG